MSSLSIDTGALDDSGRALQAAIAQLGYHGPHDVSTCGSGLVSDYAAEAVQWLSWAGMTMAIKVGDLSDSILQVGITFDAAEKSLASDARGGL